MSEKKVHPPKATPKQVKKMEKKVEKKVEKAVVKAVENKVERKFQKQASNQIKEKIKTIILGRLDSVDYEGVNKKLGPKGKEMVEKSCGHLTDMAKRYALAQAMPSMYQSKIPDAFNRNTAFYHSKRVFEVKVGFKDANDKVNYDFAFLVQPKLGNFGDPRGFQVALVTQDALLNPQNYDFEDVGTYDSLGSSDGTDIKVDTNFTPLTAKPAGYFAAFGSASGKTAALPFGSSLNINNNSYNLNPIYKPLTNSRIQLPVGDYAVNVILLGTGMTAGPGVINISTPGVFTNIGSEVVTGTSPNITAAAKNVLLTIPNNQQNYFDVFTTTGTITASFIQISPVQLNNSNAPIDDGLVETLRPTAMSVLTSYKGPLLTNGGQIAGALLPSAALDTNFFTNNPVEPGAFRNWQTIATLIEDVKDNALAKGNHTTWRQEDAIDYDLFAPSQANDYPYPAIVVAGTWNPGTDAPTSEVAIVRVEVDIQFEYRTTKSLVQKDKYIGSQDDMDMANHLLQRIDVSMENEEHVSKFKQFAGDVFRAVEVGTTIASMLA